MHSSDSILVSQGGTLTVASRCTSVTALVEDRSLRGEWSKGGVRTRAFTGGVRAWPAEGGSFRISSAPCGPKGTK